MGKKALARGATTRDRTTRFATLRKHVVLFLAANPYGTNAHKLDEQCAAIQQELKRSPHRDDFQFESRWSIDIHELMRQLNELDPAVIHFGGDCDSEGLMLQGDCGQPQSVSPRALAMMVHTAARDARAVLLNCGFSSEHADVLRAHVDCAVGMQGALSTDAARTFAIRFYGALGNRRSIGNAVSQGIAALAAKRFPEQMIPQCLTRDGLDADHVVLHSL